MLCKIAVLVSSRLTPDPVPWRGSFKKVFLKILQNEQENICTGTGIVPTVT